MLGEMDAVEIDRVLANQVIGRIGCHADDVTYVVPVSYAYDGQAVYCHSGDGQKLRMMRENPSVCFEVEEVDDLAHWRTVIAYGHFEALAGDEARAAMDRLVERMQPLTASEVVNPDRDHHLGRTPTVYRIVLDRCTGRYEAR